MTLQCEAEGSPKPVITWLRNDKELPADKTKFTQLESGSLVVKDLLPSDTGFYKCTAANPFGAKMREIILFIQGKITFFLGRL